MTNADNNFWNCSSIKCDRHHPSHNGAIAPPRQCRSSFLPLTCYCRYLTALRIPTEKYYFSLCLSLDSVCSVSCRTKSRSRRSPTVNLMGVEFLQEEKRGNRSECWRDECRHVFIVLDYRKRSLALWKRCQWLNEVYEIWGWDFSSSETLFQHNNKQTGSKSCNSL